MYCGPNTIARATGWTRDQVWLHIRYLREQRGRKLTDHPYGGTTTDECMNALNRAGFVAVPVFRDKRRRLADFAAKEGKTGTWIIYQSRHFFCWKAGDPIRYPNAVLVHAWRVVRVK